MDNQNTENQLENVAKNLTESEHPQQQRINELVKQAEDKRKKLAESVNSLQECQGDLRVCMKYQCLDLEATRRENEYLQRLLDDNGIEY